MSTFANSEDPDEMQHYLHSIRVYTVCKGKTDLQTIFFLNFNLTPLDMYNGLYPKFIVSNQKKESISIQRVKFMIWIFSAFTHKSVIIIVTPAN